MADLKFKYGTSNINEANNDPGTIYVQRTGDGKAKMYIDNPTITGADRLQIGGDIFIGDPNAEGSGADNYEVIINPNGEFLDNIVTGQDTSFKIKVEQAIGNIDTYIPSTEGLSGNTIILIIE